MRIPARADRRWQDHPVRILTAILLLGGAAACEDVVDPGGEQEQDRILFLSARDAATDAGSLYDRDIFVVDLDGTGATNLTAAPYQYKYLSLSPGGDRLAFVSDEVGCENIWVMGVDGTGRTQLTGLESGERCNSAPKWSPDGSRIAYRSSNDPELGWEVWVMNADGTGRVDITGNPSTDPGTYNDLVHGWTPDGRVVINSDRDGTMRPWVVSPDGSGGEPLFADPGYTDPYWSPDGSRIAAAVSAGTTSKVYVMNADGTGSVKVSGDIGYAYPAYHAPWSPDGRRLALQVTSELNTDIYIVSPDGTGLVRVTEDPGDDLFYGWSPEGSRILFTSNRSGNTEVYTADPDGTNLRNLSNDPREDEGPIWVPGPAGGG